MPDCEVPPLGTPQLDPLCNAGTAIGGVINDQLKDWSDQVTTWIGEAIAGSLKALTTSWIGIAPPQLTVGSAAGGVPAGTVEFLSSSVAYIAGTLLIVSMLCSMAVMAWEGRAEGGMNMLKGLFRFIIVQGAGTAIVAVLLAISTAFSVWIIDRATGGGDFAAGIAQMLMDTGGLIFILYVIIGGLAIITTLIQIGLLFMRLGAIFVLTGTLALAASFTSTEMGKAWFAKHVGWLVAYILYMPAAAIIYAAAFQLIAASDYSYDDTKTAEHIAGLTLMILAIFALPAMLRLAVPATAALASGRGTGAAVMGAAAIAIPMGAAAIHSANSGPSGSTVGSSGPSGAPATPPPPAPPSGSPAPAPQPAPVP